MCTSLRQSRVNSLQEVLGCGRKELVRKLGDLALAMLCCWLSYLEMIPSLFCACTKRTEQKNRKNKQRTEQVNMRSFTFLWFHDSKIHHQAA